jgi:hypothetical protein
MRRALLAVEDWQHRRQQEMAGATFGASQPQAIDIDMTEPADPGVRLRMLLSFLEVIRGQVKQRTFKPRQASEIETLYHNGVGWRQARLLRLLRLFNESFGPAAGEQDPELREILDKQFGPREAAGEAQYEELLRLLDEEIAHVQEEFQHTEKVNEEKAAIERDACLAPVGKTWEMMLRQEAALDRSIDRKVKILLALRKQSLAGDLPSTASDADNEPSMAHVNETPEDRGARHSRGGGNPSSCGLTWTPAYAGVTATDENAKMKERSLNVLEDKGSQRKTLERSLNVTGNKGS